MTTNKKYYWIKLKEDFFRQKEIKKLRKVAGGDTYTVIYLKMLLLALKNENKLYFEGVEDDFADELALELDEDADNIKMTLAFLQKQKLIEMINEDEYLLPQCESMTGVESTSAERVRKHRLKKKEEQKTLQCNADVTDSNKNVTTEKEKEKEKELDIEPPRERNKNNVVVEQIILKYFSLGIDEINRVIEVFEKTGKDITYLEEKLEYTKNNPNTRDVVGLLITALIKDYKNSMSNNNYKKTDFHNFDQTFLGYSEEDFMNIVENSQKHKWD